MYWIFILLYVVFFIIQIFNLFKALKNKDNKHWINLFSTAVASIISCILIVLYQNYYSNSGGIDGYDGILVILISVIALLLYFLCLFLSVLLKIIQVRELKQKNVENKKVDKKIKKKMVFKSIFLILVTSVVLCCFEFLFYQYLENMDNKRYDEVKETKLVNMTNYINNKYNLNYTVEDNVFFREYKYSDVEIAEKKHNDFYVGIFDNGEETIAVSENKEGFLSDNAQTEEIGYLIRDYYRDIISPDVDYVEIKNSDGFCKDDLINEVLQFKFNEIITKENIENFIDELLKNDVEMIFYVKDREDREALLTNLIDKLSYLEEKKNIKGLSIYLYDSNEDLIVEKENILTRGDYRYDEIHLSYYSSHMFGFVFVPNSIEFSDDFDRENEFVTIAFSNQKYDKAEDYKDKDIKLIKDWTIYNFK